MTERYTGSCLCGSVRYEVGRIKPHVHQCHCPMCLKFHGIVAATLATTDSFNFRWIQGEELLKAYTAENGTTLTFCTNCGSSLTFSNPKALKDSIEISIGTIDNYSYSQSRYQPERHEENTNESKYGVPDDDASRVAEEQSKSETIE